MEKIKQKIKNERKAQLILFIIAVIYTILSLVFFRKLLMYEWFDVIKWTLPADAAFLGLIAGMHKRDDSSEFLY